MCVGIFYLKKSERGENHLVVFLAEDESTRPNGPRLMLTDRRSEASARAS
jgi:hypothetical protein